MPLRVSVFLMPRRVLHFLALTRFYFLFMPLRSSVMLCCRRFRSCTLCRSIAVLAVKSLQATCSRLRMCFQSYCCSAGGSPRPRTFACARASRAM